jgi:PAS domain S-box-containing protein
MNILIVEDSKLVNNMLASELRAKGHGCSQAFDLAEARGLIENDSFGLVILDLHLPDGEGEEIFEVFKDEHECKIVIYTSDDDIEKRLYFFQNGVIDYLAKNSPANKIVRDIDTIISRLERNKLKNILIVDDSTLVRKQLSSIFQIRNYNVFLAKSGKEALSIFASNDISLAIVDIVLPDTSGQALIETIKKEERYKKVPIIAISGTQDPNTIKSAYKAGASDFLKKPIIYEEVALKVDLWLDMACKNEELKYNEAILQEYKNAIDNSEIVSKTDPKGFITYANERFCRISGYAREELIGKPHNLLRHPDMQKETFENMWRTIEDKKVWHGIVKNLAKDGSPYWVDSSITPIIDNNGNVVEYIAIRHDVTKIEALKEELQEQLKISSHNLWDMLSLKTNYENAINASNILTRTDAKGVITYANNEFLRVSGYARNDLVGSTHAIIKHPDNDPKLYVDIWETISSGEIWKGVIKNRAKDGQAYFVDSTIMPIKNNEDEIIEYMAIRHDVTDIVKLSQELQNTQHEIVSRMGDIAETRNKETAHHTQRVAHYSALLGEKAGLSNNEIHILYAASPMHDVGKVGIPDDVLLKPGKLNEEEWEIMKTHSHIGHSVFASSELPILKAASVIALEHHEKWDGSGYPNGLAGEEIHIFARITALADVFDALGTAREYKEAWELEKILEFIQDESGRHFDPQLVTLFFGHLDEFLKIKNNLNALC